MKIAVIGAGSWGTAIAGVLASKGHGVCLWARDRRLSEEIRSTRQNHKYLSGYFLPQNVEVTYQLGEALENTDLLVLAVPSHALRNILCAVKDHYKKQIPVVSLIKGIEVDTGFRMSQVIKDMLGQDDTKIAVLSGPNHAEEVSKRIPTATVVASTNSVLNEQMQKVFMTNEFRVYSNLDPVGVEIAGAVKNVIAIAAGISDGLGFGDNTKASLITRGMTEISRFGQILGAEPATFWGLAGIGDLIATCTSRHSRNRMFGQRIGEGERVEDIKASMNMVAEGVLSAKAVKWLSESNDVEMPICSQVYQVLYEDKSPLACVNDLMARDATHE